MRGRSIRVRGLIGALLLLVAIVIAGCGSSGGGSSAGGGGTGSSSAEGENNSSELTKETPAASGPISEFTWDLPYGEPVTLDPALSLNYSENTVLGNVCDALLRETPQRTFEPALAEKVTHPNPLTWEYKIRKGVKFFDGSPLTAADVLANLKRQADPNTESYYYSEFAKYIKSVKQTGPDTVTVTTKVPNTLLNEMMATGLGTIVKASQLKEKEFGTSSAQPPICTGAFELTKWTPGSGITLTANKHYWDKNLQPKAERVNFKFISDPTALANALISGEVEGTYEAPITAIEQLRNASDGKLYLGVTTQGLSFTPFGNKVTQNPKIRQAIYASIDRAGIAETAYSGTATPVKSTATPEASPYGNNILSKYYESLPEPGPNIEKAKKLFEEAGSPSTPIRLAVSSGDSAALQAANAIQSGAGEAGINIKIETLPPNQAIALSFEPEKARPHYDAFMSNTYYDVPNLMEFYSFVALPHALTNVTKYDNPETTKAIERGLAAESGNEKAEAMVEVAEHLDKEVPELPLLRPHERLFMNNKIAGAPVTFPYMYYPWAAMVGAGSE